MIFPLVWRLLPGPTVLKVLELIVLLAAIVYVLFTRGLGLTLPPGVLRGVL